MVIQSETCCKVCYRNRTDVASEYQNVNHSAYGSNPFKPHFRNINSDLSLEGVGSVHLSDPTKFETPVFRARIDEICVLKLGRRKDNQLIH